MNRTTLPLALAAVLVAVGSFSPALAGNGKVDLSTAAPSCPDSSGRIYVDCGNGTITDNRSGLVWLQDASCYFPTSWSDAMLTSFGMSDGDCGLTDGSAPGDWRLATKAEWEAMIADAGAMGCSPFLTNDDGTLCWADDPESSIQNLTTDFYYSATSNENIPGLVWFVNMTNGFLGPDEGKTANTARFWPVRDGQ